MILFHINDLLCIGLIFMQVETITKMVESFYQCLRQHGSFHPPNSEQYSQEPPSAELWVLFFLVRHFTTIGDTQKAMEYIEKAIEHTPTMMELYMTKAKVYKVIIFQLYYCVFIEFISNIIIIFVFTDIVIY